MTTLTRQSAPQRMTWQQFPSSFPSGLILLVISESIAWIYIRRLLFREKIQNNRARQKGSNGHATWRATTILLAYLSGVHGTRLPPSGIPNTFREMRALLSTSSRNNAIVYEYYGEQKCTFLVASFRFLKNASQVPCIILYSTSATSAFTISAIAQMSQSDARRISFKADHNKWGA